MHRGRRWRPTLQQTIGLGLGLVILVTAAMVTAWSYFSSRKQLLEFSRELITYNANVVKEQVHGYLEPAKSAAELTLALVQSGMVSADDNDELEKYFFDFMTVHPTVSMLNYGNERGDFLMVKRQSDGSLSTKIVAIDDEGGREVVWRHRDRDGPLTPVREVVTAPEDQYDARTRPWYRGAIADRALHWTGVYVFFTDKKPGVTAAIPRFDPAGTPLGVLSVDIGLTDLSRFLRDNIRVGKTGHAFLLDESAHLIAIPQAEELTIVDPTSGAAGERLRLVAESTTPEVAALAGNAAYADYFDLVFDMSTAPPKERTIRYDVGGTSYIATLMPIRVSDARRWLAAVVAQEDEFLSSAKRANRNALIAAGAFAILAMIVGFILARIIGRSLTLLVEESARVQRLEIDSAPAQSRFREVDEVLRAFEGMKTGLRSFQKYVPVDLVRSLIDNNQDATLGGEARTLTIFFSDIRDFTTISEGLAPTALAAELAAYLSTVTHHINERRGTVDKYIGDAIMAFWGAPEVVQDHAVQACYAALDAQHDIDARRATGEHPDFYTRIGIHTAEVVVGNFGSDQRLNYTIIGDGVNLASRLEGVNKAFGTQILISEDTRALVHEHFETRRIGLVAVKGREQPCVTYELLGVKGSVHAARLETVRLYELALDDFLARNWEDAIALFIDVLEQAPNDRAATAVLAQAQLFARNPPPANWTGAFAMETK